MYDLPGVGGTFGGLGESHAACDAWRSQAFARGVRGHTSPGKIFKWCVLEHIFINILLEKK